MGTKLKERERGKTASSVDCRKDVMSYGILPKFYETPNWLIAEDAF